MSDRIDTHAAAIEEMLRWANGERSHHNLIQAGPFNTADGAGIAGALVPLADAAEVQKWAVVAGALVSQGPPDHGEETRLALLRRLASVIERELVKLE